MKKWSVAVSLVLLSACSYSDRIAALERQNKEMRKELDAQKNIVDLDTQAKCSNAAKAFYIGRFQFDKDTTVLEYSNHYNKLLGKCFIYVQWNYHAKANYPKSPYQDLFKHFYLFDVYENMPNGEFGESALFALNPLQLAPERFTRSWSSSRSSAGSAGWSVTRRNCRWVGPGKAFVTVGRSG